MTECLVCGREDGTHDVEIHQATRRIHKWFRKLILTKIRPIAKPVMKKRSQA